MHGRIKPMGGIREGVRQYPLRSARAPGSGARIESPESIRNLHGQINRRPVRVARTGAKKLLQIDIGGAFPTLPID